MNTKTKQYNEQQPTPKCKEGAGMTDGFGCYQELKPGCCSLYCFVFVFKSTAVQTLSSFFLFCFSGYVLRLVYPCTDSVEQEVSNIFHFTIFYMSGSSWLRLRRTYSCTVTYEILVRKCIFRYRRAHVLHLAGLAAGSFDVSASPGFP